MNKKIVWLNGKEYEFEELTKEDILFSNHLFKTQYKNSFNELFGNILFSEKRFRLYIYKVYKRDKRGEQLAKWIFNKFIELLVEDLIYENDTFKFPRKDIYLSVKDANKFRKSWKIYVPSSYGKDYRLFIQKKGNPFYCRLAKPWFRKVIKHGKKQPYI